MYVTLGVPALARVGEVVAALAVGVFEEVGLVRVVHLTCRLVCIGERSGAEEGRRGSAVICCHRLQSTQLVLMVQGVDVFRRIILLLLRRRAVEVGYLSVERCRHLVGGEWQADAFPCGVGGLGVGGRLACVPRAVADGEGDGHAEVVVGRCRRGALHEVQVLRSTLVVAVCYGDVVSSDSGFVGILVISEHGPHRIVRLVIRLCAFGGVNEEVARDAIAGHEAAVCCCHVAERRIVALARTNVLRTLGVSHVSVCLTGEVHGCGGSVIDVCAHRLIALFVGVVVVCRRRGVASVSHGAPYTLCHGSELVRAY